MSFHWPSRTACANASRVQDDRAASSRLVKLSARRRREAMLLAMIRAIVHFRALEKLIAAITRDRGHLSGDRASFGISHRPEVAHNLEILFEHFFGVDARDKSGDWLSYRMLPSSGSD